ncbi:MAG: hypothetical protein QOK42_2062 [Frankiaceae bacterium]|nr:hypothetical protein [Frankiaceae bacterium]
MTTVDEQGRPEPPQNADEKDTLLGFLDFQRATLEWRCRGLDSAGLQTKVAASSITLGGLLKHMALVEWSWFSHWLHDSGGQAPWDSIDWKATPDWEWESAAEDSPDDLRTMWQEAVAQSRSQVEAALATGGLEQRAKRTWPDGTAPSLRWILVHMVEEYSRHNGHADLIRESIDGQTGE